MSEFTENANINMEESNGQRSTSDASINLLDTSNIDQVAAAKIEYPKMLLFRMNGEYISKIHQIMVKHNKCTMSDVLFMLIDKELESK